MSHLIVEPTTNPHIVFYQKPKMLKYAQMTGGHQQVPTVYLWTPFVSSFLGEVTGFSPIFHTAATPGKVP